MRGVFSPEQAARVAQINERIEWLRHLLSQVEHLPLRYEDGSPAAVCQLIGHHNAEINRLRSERSAIFYRRDHQVAA